MSEWIDEGLSLHWVESVRMSNPVLCIKTKSCLMPHFLYPFGVQRYLAMLVEFH